jgi:hypothetical protein
VLNIFTQIVYCCWLAVELTFLFFFVVETKNRSLEETAALFDGNEILDQITNAAHHGDVKEGSMGEEEEFVSGS